MQIIVTHVIDQRTKKMDLRMIAQVHFSFVIS